MLIRSFVEEDNTVILDILELPHKFADPNYEIQWLMNSNIHQPISVSRTVGESEVIFSEQHIEFLINPLKPIELPYRAKLSRNTIEGYFPISIEDQDRRVQIIGRSELALAAMANHFGR